MGFCLRLCDCAIVRLCDWAIKGCASVRRGAVIRGGFSIVYSVMSCQMPRRRIALAVVCGSRTCEVEMMRFQSSLHCFAKNSDGRFSPPCPDLLR